MQTNHIHRIHTHTILHNLKMQVETCAVAGIAYITYNLPCRYRFPRLTMPVSQVLTSLINFGIQAVMYLIFWVYFFATGSGVTFTLWVLAVPFVVLEVMLLGLGVGIIVSSLTTKYRDLAIAVGFGVQLWMYASPVVYPLSMLDNSPRLRVLVQLNPMTSPIEIFRMATLGTGTVTTFGVVYSLIFTAAALVLGVVLFSRIEKTFMDTV